MAHSRPAKPWLHGASGYWCTSVNRRRIYLDKDYQAAARKLRQLCAEEKRQDQAGTNWSEVPLADLVDEFLDDIKARKKPVTHQSYRYRLLRALRVNTGVKVQRS